MTDHTSSGGGWVSPVPGDQRSADSPAEADTSSAADPTDVPVPMITDVITAPSPPAEPGSTPQRDAPADPLGAPPGSGSPGMLAAGTVPADTLESAAGHDDAVHGGTSHAVPDAPNVHLPSGSPGTVGATVDSTTPPLPRVIAVANQKGGVGKTTTTVNMGAALAERDFRVLVVDLDPQGNATTGLGINYRVLESTMYDVLLSNTPIDDCIEPTEVKGLFVAPASLDLAGAEIELVPAFNRESKLKRALDEVRDEYDYILIDCPPSLGLLTVNGLVAASEVMVPIQCEYYALEGLGQLLRNVGLVQANLNPGLEVRGIVLTMYDGRTKLADQVVSEVRAYFGEKVYQTVVPRTVRLSEAPSFGQPIIVFDPTSRGAKAYRDLAEEVSRGATRRSG